MRINFFHLCLTETRNFAIFNTNLTFRILQKFLLYGSNYNPKYAGCHFIILHRAISAKCENLNKTEFQRREYIRMNILNLNCIFCTKSQIKL